MIIFLSLAKSFYPPFWLCFLVMTILYAIVVLSVNFLIHAIKLDEYTDMKLKGDRRKVSLYSYVTITDIKESRSQTEEFINHSSFTWKVTDKYIPDALQVQEKEKEASEE